MVDKIHTSTGKDDWETPPDFFAKLDAEFNFTLDACAEQATAKCKSYFTKEQNALQQKWTGRVFCNPPYSKNGQQDAFVKKAYKSVLNGDCELVVLLIPARTDTMRWHEWIFGKATEIRYLRGRLTFWDNGKPAEANAQFPSAVVIFRANQ